MSQKRQTLSDRFNNLPEPDYSSFQEGGREDSFRLEPAIVRPKFNDYDNYQAGSSGDDGNYNDSLVFSFFLFFCSNPCTKVSPFANSH